jgi:hypothetical protein
VLDDHRGFIGLELSLFEELLEDRSLKLARGFRASQVHLDDASRLLSFSRVAGSLPGFIDERQAALALSSLAAICIARRARPYRPQ